MVLILSPGSEARNLGLCEGLCCVVDNIYYLWFCLPSFAVLKSLTTRGDFTVSRPHAHTLYYIACGYYDCTTVRPRISTMLSIYDWDHVHAH